MAREAQIAITTSIVLHILALFVLAGVKLYKDESIVAEIPVTFIYKQEKTPLRRSPPVRPRISLHHSPQRHSLEQYAIYPERASSIEFYVSAPESVFSEARPIESEEFQNNVIKRPFIRQQEHLLTPKATGAVNETYMRVIQMKPRIPEGHDLLEGILSRAEPDMKRVDDALQQFLSVVRKKIESEKKYPLAAQRLEIEGRTGVRMTILKDGELEEVKVVESSGYEILDSAALRSVQKAAPFPPIPEAAKLDKVEISIYLVFKLS